MLSPAPRRLDARAASLAELGAAVDASAGGPDEEQDRAEFVAAVTARLLQRYEVLFARPAEV